MLRKKAQTTIFVIIGIVLVVIVALFFINKSIKQKEKIKDEIEDIQSFSEIRSKVSIYSEQCLKITTQDIINKIWIADENDIYQYLKKHYLECVDDFNAIEKEGYEIEFKPPEYTVGINDGFVNIEMKFPITITRDEQETYLEDFDYNLAYISNPEIPEIKNKILNLEDVQDYEMIFENVVYKKYITSDPLILQVYVVKINLNDVDIRFLTTPPLNKQGVRTNFMQTSSFLYTHNLQVAINGDGWDREGDNSISGLSAFHGDIYGSPNSGEPSIYFSKDNEVSFLEKPKEIWNAVSGFSVIAKDGMITKDTVGKEKREPRTSIGLDENNNILIFIIVDGRQPGFSSGIGLENLAKLQLEHGATIALNMDGGGSSTLAIQGKFEEGLENSIVVNSPSDELEYYEDELGEPSEVSIPYTGTERIVANHLGVSAKPWFY